MLWCLMKIIKAHMVVHKNVLMFLIREQQTPAWIKQIWYLRADKEKRCLKLFP